MLSRSLFVVNGGVFMYGKIVDGKLQYAPKNYVDSNGVMTLNFDSNIEKMTEEGYKEVINNVPKYDELTHKVVKDMATEINGKINVVYKVVEKELTDVEKIELLTRNISALASTVDFLLFNLLSNKGEV